MKNRTALLAVPALLLSLALSGCATAPQQTEAAAVVRYACYAADAAYFGFDTYDKAKPGRITAGQRKWRAGLPLLTKPICDDPAAVVDRTKALDTLNKVTDALIDFVKAVSAAPAP